MADDKYTKRVLYKPSPESKKMAEDYVAPVVEAGLLSAIPIGGLLGAAGRGASRARGFLTGERAAVRAAKDMKAGDMRSTFLKEAEAGPSPRPAKDIDATGSRADFLYKAKRGEIKAKGKPAKDLKAGDARSQTLNKGKPQPAADLTKGDARSKFLNSAKKGDIKAKSSFETPSAVKARDKAMLAAAGGAGAAGLGVVGYRSAPKSNAEEKKNFGNKSSGTSFPKGKGTASLPTKKSTVPSTEPKGDVKTPKLNVAPPTAGGVNRKMSVDEAKDYMKARRQGTVKVSASDKSRAAGKTAKQVYHGNWTGAGAARKPKTLQEAARRNQTDEYMKARMAPKRNLLDLFKKKR